MILAFLIAGAQLPVAATGEASLDLNCTGTKEFQRLRGQPTSLKLRFDQARSTFTAIEDGHSAFVGSVKKDGEMLWMTWRSPTTDFSKYIELLLTTGRFRAFIATSKSQALTFSSQGVCQVSKAVAS